MDFVTQGRNERCACGSGKKFKKCCRRGQSGAWTGPTFWAHPPGQPGAAPPPTGEWTDYYFVKDRGWTHKDDLKPGDQYKVKEGGWETVAAAPDRIIRTTMEHRFFVEGKGWTALGEIRPGERIRTEDGWVTVREVEDTGKYETVYNFRVADYHTYFVGGEGCAVWAHNTYLPGADKSAAALGEQYTRRALALLALFPDTEHWKMTIAVSSVGSQEIVSLYANPWNSSQPVPPGRKLVPIDLIRAFKAAVEQSGAVFMWADGATHAEVVLHSNYPSIQAMGLSNPKGPCDACKAHFRQIGWRNIWYPPV